MPSDSRPRFGGTTILSLMAVLAIAACASKPPPTPAPVVATVAPVDKPPPAPRPSPPPKPVDLHWAFSTNPDMCTAIASGPGGSLQVQTTAARQILVSAKFASPTRGGTQLGRPAKLSFSGPAGQWSVAGTWRHQEFTSARALDERGVANLLALLGGGTAAVTAGTAQLGSARLPPASGDGSAWVQCPKQMMVPS